MKTILCFGDSNTWGHRPGDGARYPYETRWTGVMQRELGNGHRVIEEGLSGRTTVHDNPLVPYRNGREYLIPCLQSHRPLDLVVIFLGTNDLADRYGLPPLDVASGAVSLAHLAARSETGVGGAVPIVLLLGLPRLGNAELPETMSGARAKAAELPRCFEIAAREAGVPLLDLANVTACSNIDGYHLNADGHSAVGCAVAKRVATLLA